MIARRADIRGLADRRWDRRAAARALALLAAVGVVVAGVTLLRIETGIESFLPGDDPVVADLRERARSFGGDPIVVLVESDRQEALTGADSLPRLVGVEGELAELPDVAAVYGPGTALNQVAIQAQNLLAQISGRRDALRAVAERSARARGAGDAEVAGAVAESTVEFDRRYGALLVRGLPAGLPTLRNPDFVRTVLFDPSGEPRAQWRYVAPSRSAVALLVRPAAGLDQAGTERLVDAVRATVTRETLPAASRITVTGVPAVTAALGERVRAEAPILGGAAVALLGFAFLVLPLPGNRAHRLMPLAIALAATATMLAVAGWIGTPLSLGVVAFLPILLGIGSFYALYLIHGGQRRRVAVVALASAASFASLSVSPLPFVRELGTALALGVLCSLGLALLVARRTPEPEPRPVAAPTGRTAGCQESNRPSAGRRRLVLICVVALAAIGWAGLPDLTVQADPQRLAAGLGALDDAAHAERILESSGEMSIVLRGPDVAAPEALAWGRAAQEAVIVEFGDRVRPVVSLPDVVGFLGDRPTAGQVDAALDLVPAYLADAVIRSDRQAALLTFGLRLQDLGAQARLLDDVRAAVPPPPAGYVVDIVGLPVVAARAFKLVAEDRYLGNVLGIVVAGAVLLLGLRRRRDAARAVLAAALATGWGLALVHLAGVELSPLTASLGSLTAGVGCEFAVLLGHAARRTDERLRLAVAAAAATAALGFAVTALSGLAVLRQFGLFLAGAVALSYLAARLVVRLLPDPTSPSAVPPAPSGPSRAALPPIGASR